MSLKRQHKWLISVIIIALIAIGSYFTYAHHRHIKQQAANQTKKPIVVRTESVKQKSLTASITATGTLLPLHSTTITSKVDGYIQAIDFKEGERVKAGQQLIQLDNRQELASVAKNKATLKLNKNSYQRNMKLNKQHLVSNQDLDKLQSQYEQNKASLVASLTDLSNKTLKAPFSGTIGSFLLNVGDFVKAGTPLVRLTDDSKLIVKYTLPEQYINQLKLGQTVNVSLENFSTPIEAQGVISFISPNVDATSQTFVVHAHINNTKHLFHPGNFVKVKQTLGHAKPTLLIPLRSVSHTIDGAHVLVVNGGIVKQVNVTLGQMVGSDIVVLSGLKPNDKVITDGQSQAKPGSKVTVKH